jgi:hypothetical protein
VSQEKTRDHQEQAVKKVIPPDWPESFWAVLGSCDEEIERLPQRPISEMKNPFDDDDR